MQSALKHLESMPITLETMTTQNSNKEEAGDEQVRHLQIRLPDSKVPGAATPQDDEAADHAGIDGGDS
jgi:hypothetical protein